MFTQLALLRGQPEPQRAPRCVSRMIVSSLAVHDRRETLVKSWRVRPLARLLIIICRLAEIVLRRRKQSHPLFLLRQPLLIKQARVGPELVVLGIVLDPAFIDV